MGKIQEYLGLSSPRLMKKDNGEEKPKLSVAEYYLPELPIVEKDNVVIKEFAVDFYVSTWTKISANSLIYNKVDFKDEDGDDNEVIEISDMNDSHPDFKLKPLMVRKIVISGDSQLAFSEKIKNDWLNIYFNMETNEICLLKLNDNNVVSSMIIIDLCGLSKLSYIQQRFDTFDVCLVKIVKHFTDIELIPVSKKLDIIERILEGLEIQNYYEF